MNKERVKLIYILSNGRSGSTILDLILGSMPNTWTLGEAQLLDLEYDIDGICGSGEKLKESIFWKDIIEEIEFEKDDVKISHFRKTSPNLKSHTGKVLRWDLLKEAFLGITNKEYPKKRNTYGVLNQGYFQKVLNHVHHEKKMKDIEWIIDASKDPYRLMWLQQSGMFDIKVIHLLKEPTSFVYSTTLKYNLSNPLIKCIRMSIRWVVENKIMHQVCKKYFKKNEYYLLQYKDMASDPSGTIDKIVKHFGIKLGEYTENQLWEKENYAISGNKSRWERKKIRYDDSWEKKMPASYRWIVKAITLFSRKKYNIK